MQNKRLIITALLVSGIILLVVVGLFLRSLSQRTQNTSPGTDIQTNPPLGKIDNGRMDTSPTQPPLDEGSGPAEFQPDIDAEQKLNYPDVYLYNRVPFENQYFRIEGTLRPEGSPDFSYTVTAKDSNQTLAKTKLSEWLTELGLSPGQIAGLLIEYR
jgi:hypothetical protein